MAVSKKTGMAFKSYQNQARVLVRNYVLADAFIPYTSILAGLFATKMVYDISQLISTFYFRTYTGLTKIQQIEWNNRSISSVHAIFIATMSLYFVFWSDIYSDQQIAVPVTFRSSPLSTSVLGVIHHTFSAIAVAYAMFTGEGQLYTFMVLISELTTPEINLRWYLDTSGLKKSKAYLINGVVIFFAWMVARILLFLYLFCHVCLHHDQVKQMHPVGFVLVHTVPAALGIMNLMWFRKIIKGLLKTLAKRH